jgi:hypothetical protein
MFGAFAHVALADGDALVNRAISSRWAPDPDANRIH